MKLKRADERWKNETVDRADQLRVRKIRPPNVVMWLLYSKEGIVYILSCH